MRESLFGHIPEPVPATKAMPSWFRNTEKALSDDFGESHHTSTVRGCMPFFNALTMGWILRAPQDISIRTNRDGVKLQYEDIPGTQDTIHDLDAAAMPATPDALTDSVTPLKLNTHWYIDGHEGAKVWVMPPQNRFTTGVYDGLVFTSGVYNINSTYIDTGIIALLEQRPNVSIDMKAGDPIAQLMFFDRDGLVNDAIVEEASPEDVEGMNSIGIERAIHTHHYADSEWDPVGRARVQERGSGPSCPNGHGRSS